MPVSGSEYTWYDLAFGPRQCPLAWLTAVRSKPSLAGNKMDWDRGRGNHHSGIVWLSAMLKDRLSAGPADLTSGGAAVHHSITSSCNNTCRPWASWKEKVFKAYFCWEKISSFLLTNQLVLFYFLTESFHVSDHTTTGSYMVLFCVLFCTKPCKILWIALSFFCFLCLEYCRLLMSAVKWYFYCMHPCVGTTHITVRDMITGVALIQIPWICQSQFFESTTFLKRRWIRCVYKCKNK